jgi:hypothetical protein
MQTAVTKTFSASASEPNFKQRITWRCMDRRVLACFDGGASGHCQKWNAARTPTVDMRQFCRDQPNSAIPMAVAGLAAYDWQCKGRTPVAARLLVVLDKRGYHRDQWADVTQWSVAASARSATVGPNAAPQLSSIGANIITTDGMLGISAGMTRSQIAHLIQPHGEYDRDGTFGPAEAFACNIYRTRSGLAEVMIERGMVTSISTVSPKLGTAAGARAGVADASLRKFYGNRLRRTEGQYSGWDYYYYSASGNGLRFHVENGKIVSIRAGGKSIEYSEGCL